MTTTTNEFTSKAAPQDVTLPDAECGSHVTYAIATALLKEISGAPCSPTEQKILAELNPR